MADVIRGFPTSLGQGDVNNVTVTDVGSDKFALDVAIKEGAVGGGGTEFDDGDAIDTDSQGGLLIGTTGVPGTARALRCEDDGALHISDGGDTISVDGVPQLTVENAISATTFDLQAAPFSQTSSVVNDYIFDSVELNFSTTESKTITVTTSDGTEIYQDTNTSQHVSLSEIDRAFNGGENFTIAVTQFSSPGTMDCKAVIREGGATLGGTASVVITDGTLDAALFTPSNGPTGLVTYSAPRVGILSQQSFFTNDTYGVQMNQDAGFGGTPELVHDGGDTTAWVASAISGTWDFTSTAQANTGTQSVDATGTANDDEALFEDGTSTDMGTHTAITGFIYITGFSAAGVKHVQLRCRNAGVDVGSSVNIDEFVSVDILNLWMKFTISKSLLGITTETIDEIVIKTVNTGGGPAPNYFLDDIQIEEVGNPIVYQALAPPGFIFNTHYTDLVLCSDSYTPAITDGVSHGFAYDEFMGLPRLENGIIVDVLVFGLTIFAASFQDFGDSFIRGSTIVNSISQGGKTCTTVRAPVRASLSSAFGDGLQITIADDLSGLSSLTGTLVGDLEAIE